MRDIIYPILHRLFVPKYDQENDYRPTILNMLHSFVPDDLPL